MWHLPTFTYVGLSWENIKSMKQLVVHTLFAERWDFQGLNVYMVTLLELINLFFSWEMVIALTMTISIQMIFS